MSSPFLFKQFTIKQDLCAMKVGTDGVLLGAWASPNNNNILDIGSGSGLIALMLAQRNQNSQITAIDIDKNAYLQSLENVIKSKWQNRIEVLNIALQDYKPNNMYDLIVTNPPYFIDAFKAPNRSRNTARHTQDLPFIDLINAVTSLLSNNGKFALILPLEEGKLFLDLALQHSLFLNRRCLVKPNNIKPAKRVMMEFSFFENLIVEEELIIETDKRHQYSKDYISLTKDFYLKM